MLRSQAKSQTSSAYVFAYMRSFSKTYLACFINNISDLMRMGHHGYQPAGGGGDGVLAVTSSSLSEIKV